MPLQKSPKLRVCWFVIFLDLNVMLAADFLHWNQVESSNFWKRRMRRSYLQVLLAAVSCTVSESATAYLSELCVERERYHGEFKGGECSISARNYSVLRRIIEIEYSARLARPLSGSLTKRQRLPSVAELVQQHPGTAYASLFDSIDRIMNFCSCKVEWGLSTLF